MKRNILAIVVLLVVGWALYPLLKDTGSPSGAQAAPPNTTLQKPTSARVFLTAKDTPDRLTDIGTVAFASLPQPDENFPTVFIDPTKNFQAIVGIGGAFTDAAAETFYKLPENKREELLRAYFDPNKGIGYALGRTNINSCDFSSESYSYAKPGDTALSSFSIAHDLKYKVPFIKAALRLAPDLKLFASPWSPPAWMKTNDDMLHGGRLKPEYFETWAHYYVRFIQEYAKQGVTVWGLTVQNEPMAVQTWESCIYTAEEERDFVKNHLGPELHRSGLDGVKLMIWDHNRGLMYQRAQTVLEDPDAARYVWGTAFHWYVGDHFDNVRLVHDAFPDKHLLFSEGCNGGFDWKAIDLWKWGENYGRSMVQDLNNGASGWTDWNLLLDERGGPNHVGNYCFAPIHADTRDGTLHYMNSYYYIGHFSKFARPGARRVACTSSSDDLQATAFLNPDGHVAVVVLNLHDKPIDFQVWVSGSAARSALPPHSIATLVF
jgi:glucosylceramidase